ncbi:hypothetical protein Lfu02_73440 [Longispora fulva]|uniref:Uncharacterized protein n=1 Tax=Longispora fulva TaxID=619741 RepID=A0A8J7G6S8_9ACTN|nr:ribonuclease domain-containing protein [Longispora fulva]MBG6133930.1 hypothetical protein [Longispora fulva]GIG62972.1 hypothetical protein Lfu02_73440 [Longispora fulva]
MTGRSELTGLCEAVRVIGGGTDELAHALHGQAARLRSQAARASTAVARGRDPAAARAAAAFRAAAEACARAADVLLGCGRVARAYAARNCGGTSVGASAGAAVIAPAGTAESSAATGSGVRTPVESAVNRLRTAEAANPLIESLRNTGRLPANYVTKDVAKAAGWEPGKALGNYVPGGQMGGDLFGNNAGDVVPPAPGRTWREADVGLRSDMSRKKQPGTRLLWSNDGLAYITCDHYETIYELPRWK